MCERFLCNSTKLFKYNKFVCRKDLNVVVEDIPTKTKSVISSSKNIKYIKYKICPLPIYGIYSESAHCRRMYFQLYTWISRSYFVWNNSVYKHFPIVKAPSKPSMKIFPTSLDEVCQEGPLFVGYDELVPLVRLQPQALQGVVLDKLHPE